MAQLDKERTTSRAGRVIHTATTRTTGGRENGALIARPRSWPASGDVAITWPELDMS